MPSIWRVPQRAEYPPPNCSGTASYHDYTGPTGTASLALGRSSLEQFNPAGRVVSEYGLYVAYDLLARVGSITAEVTASSADELELARGGTAFATFKATGTRLVPLA